MTDDASKLPAWPEDVVPTIRAMRQWDLQERRAALARMEALKAFIAANRHAIRAPMTVVEREAMDALLAACERGTS